MGGTVLDFVVQFITVGLGSGFAVALTKIAFDARKDRGQQVRNRRHLALRLASYLEGYAINCASMAADHRTATESEGNAGRYLGRVPEPGPLPESGVYDLLDIDILDKVLDFPQRRQMAQENASFWWDVVGDHDSYQTALEENTIKMGILALEIARQLRTTYKIKSRNLTFEAWNIDDYFAKEAKRLTEVEKKRKADDAESAINLAE